MTKHATGEIKGIHRLPLYGAAAVVVFAVVAVLGSHVTDMGKVERSLGVPIADRSISFRNEANGAVTVLDADTQEEITQFGVGEGTFVRMSVRSMSLNRKSKRVSYNLPYRLVRTEAGKLSIVDPETGHFIKLNAFGSIALSSFSKILPETTESGA